MRLPGHSTATRILTTAGLALALLALVALLASTAPARAGGLLAPHSQAADLRIAKSAVTEADPAGGSVVYNGGIITYTLRISNYGSGSATDVNIEDVLPVNGNVLQEVGCSPAEYCKVVKDKIPFSVGRPPYTSTIYVEKPVKVTATFTAPALSDFPLTVQVWGRVTCQAADTSFPNSAHVTWDGGAGLDFSNQVNTLVQSAPPAQDGHFSISAAPDWCSQSGPVVAASDMDWGDFDGDGDLDLALVSQSQGVFVYRNSGGHLALFWQDNAHSAEGVRWADFDNNGYLELLISGEYTGAGSDLPDEAPGPPYGYSYTGFNYLYRFNGSTFFQYDDFTTNDGAWRAAVADFSGDGYPDLAMISYYGGCTIHLYRNSGTDGRFNRSDPTNTTQSYCLLVPPFYNYGSGHDRSARSAAWADFDNDGDPDLAVSHFDASNNSLIRVYVNSSGSLTETNYVPVDSGVGLAYDLAWGDYDGDGDLDLAAALWGGGVRIYRNNWIPTYGTSFSLVSTVTGLTAGAVDWADFNGDGFPELAVGATNTLPRIYQYDALTGAFVELPRPQVASKGNVYSLRGVDYDNDGDIDLAFANYSGESWLFGVAAPFLQPRDTAQVGTFAASSVVWGDVNGGYPDLAYGTNNSAKVFLNDNSGGFPASAIFSPNPTARSAALGDVDGDGDLDLALGRNGRDYLYLNQGGGSFTSSPSWFGDLADDTFSLLFADVNQDNHGRPDLVAGNYSAPTRLYLNQGGALAVAPTWQSSESDSTYQVARGYYDGDALPDLAVANGSGPTSIYRNTGFDGFSLAQTLPAANTRGVAWGDYDGDGDMDLALANYGQPVQVYRNNGGTLSLAWTAPVVRNTTSVAWGDWDNDGDLDLAVGNYDTGDYDQFNQVYANLGSTAGQVNLVWLWTSAQAHKTTGLAWGDYDGDGDLDLAVSREDAGGPAGIYKNTYVLAAHLNNALFPQELPVSQNPVYLAVDRPGSPDQVFVRSVLTDATAFTIPITFRVFDPNGTRQPLGNQPGHGVKVASYQYSLDGGGRWYTARVSPTLGVDAPLATYRQGVAYTVNWRAGEDLNANNPNQSVSDDVRFRITITRQNTPTLVNAAAGRLQQVVASAASPPFRIRNISCIWPEDPYIDIVPTPPISAGVPFRLTGWVTEWGSQPSGITFTWDFGSVITLGQVVDASYTAAGTYVVTLTVSEPPCPIGRFDFVTTTLTIMPRSWDNGIYLPIILKSSIGGAAGAARPGTGGVTLQVAPHSPRQVTGLRGQVQAEGTTLRWNPSPADDAIAGYRIYRSGIKTPGFRRLVELPATVTTYTDAAACGYAYYVTAYNAQGESPASTSSFYSPPCR
jgi:uncharacterized repeat protein (TIGR01451 family)